MKKNILIIGISSGIGYELAKMYLADGYRVVGTYRTELGDKTVFKNENINLLHLDISSKESLQIFLDTLEKLSFKWDILISTPSYMLPIKNFFDVDFDEWEASVHLNLLDQLRAIHGLYSFRNKKIVSDIVFFSSGGINSAVTEMSAYMVSKITLLKMSEYLDAENDDINSFVIGPGWTKTKTHEQILTNLPKTHPKHIQTQKFMKDSDGTDFADIYECINWLIQQGKEVVGGRNFSVVHDPWRNKEMLLDKLKSDNGLYKLKRHGNDWHK